MIRNDYKTLLIRRENSFVLTVTLNRPEVANAFNTVMSQELYHLFESFALEDEGFRCIVVSGAGSRAFCAGGDLKERLNMSNETWIKQHLEYERMVRAIKDCPIPIIGAVNGAAYGGGCEIACLLDFLYASDTAKFSFPETSLGIVPGAGGTQTLARAIGERRAKELIMTGKVFTSEQALRWGLVNRVYPLDQLMPKVLEISQKIANNGPIAVRQAKLAIHRGLQMSLSDGLKFEIEAYKRTVFSKDREEGVLAFNEKRKPKYVGK